MGAVIFLAIVWTGHWEVPAVTALATTDMAACQKATTEFIMAAELANDDTDGPDFKLSWQTDCVVAVVAKQNGA